MKEEIEKLFIDAVYEDMPPNVFADKVMQIISKQSVRVDILKVGDTLLRITEPKHLVGKPLSTKNKTYKIEKLRSNYMGFEQAVCLRMDGGLLRWYSGKSITKNYRKVNTD